MVFLLSDLFFVVYCLMDFFFSDLPFFWLMFCSKILEHLEEYKKGNKNSVFFSFFYYLLKSIFFSIFFVFDRYFSLRSTYFCSILFCWMNVLFTDILFFVYDLCWIEFFVSDILSQIYFLCSVNSYLRNRLHFLKLHSLFCTTSIHS